MVPRRSAFLATVAVLCTFAIYYYFSLIPSHKFFDSCISEAPIVYESPLTVSNGKNTTNYLKGVTNSPLSAQVLDYFDQTFSLKKKSNYDFPALRRQCARSIWLDGDVYLRCGAMSAGITSIISQLKVCLKMAIEAGVGIVLPSMPLRDSTDLKNFNFFNEDAYMNYEKWFDVEHLIIQFKNACPQMRVLHPDLLESSSIQVKNRWNIDIGSAPGYQQFQSYFWPGRPFKAFFEDQHNQLRQFSLLSSDRNDSQEGITVISISSQFLIFRITDDPTGQDLKLWNDLSHLIRFLEVPRIIVHELLSYINRPFYGVHFRVESDTIWSTLENQLAVDLDALDRAWAQYGTPNMQKPLVYLACGDEEQVEKFVAAGNLRGWEVTHKWLLVKSNVRLLKMINDLPFDFQGVVDMGIMVRSHFFLGITGSAFSSTIANVRDVTGRYRGSSFTVFDDENARTHLFNDQESGFYPCCL